MERERSTERDVANTVPREGAPPPSRDATGDALAPAETDVLLREDAAETMPSRALTDPRELTPDQKTRLAADTTAAPQDAVTPSGAMAAPQVATADDAGDTARNMAGRPLPAAPGTGGSRSGADVMGLIQEGMRVVDAAGEDLGKVELVSMGDPEAATTEGQEMPPPGEGVFAGLGRALTGSEAEPDVPEPFRSRLIREGYVKVDGKGWIDTDRYFTPDMIAAVEADAIRLAVTRDQIPRES